MSISKGILAIYIAITFILSFIIWKNKKFQKFENYGALMLFVSTIFGLAFLSFDQFLISTEHDDLFYYIELIIFFSLDLLISIIFFIVRKKHTK